MVKNGYDYYHLLSGVDLPIKSAQYLVDFFEKHKGLKFFRIADDDDNRQVIRRNTDYWYLFSRFSRTELGEILQKTHIPQMTVRLQKILRLSRCSKDKWALYKGDNWLSVTHDAVECILAHEDYIRRRFRFTMCPDEIYKQTILMNCGFAERMFKPREDGNMNSALRSIDWKRGRPYVWTFADREELMKSDNMFARKFSTVYDRTIIDYINDNV